MPSLRIGTDGRGPSPGLGNEGATDSSSWRIRNGESIQVCASQNALFALDEQGEIYPYYFNVKTPVRPVATRESEEKSTEAARGLPLVVVLPRLESRLWVEGSW
jgi:hypothetical protein